jgi:diacylglycerol O-acyltransferase / wax synthase
VGSDPSRIAEPLSAADRSSLAAEQGPVTMGVGGVLVFAAGPGLEHARVLERVERRLHLIPRYRQRLQSPAPAVTNPVWVDDEQFDLGWHVRRAALAAPGGPDELAELVGHELSRRLDRSRPLWELTVIEGLAGGERGALLAKMHHALVDGVAAVDIGTVLLDPTEEPLDLPAPDGPWKAQPYDRARHLARLSLGPMVRGQRLLAEGAQRALAATDPRRAAADLRRATDLVAELARTRPQAPMTPLNRPIGPNRRYATARAELAELKAATKAHGATVNDAILAIVAGALRGYLAADPPGGRPVALVPVSVRQPGEEGGNRISTVLVDLPTDEPDPAARLAGINAAMRELKGSAAVRAGALIVGASGWAPPVVSSTLARAMSGVRAFNVVVSNVPGPQQPFWLNGQRLLEAYPAVPLNPANQGLTIGVLSYDGGVHFGLLADRDLDPPLGAMQAALEAAIAELLDMFAPPTRG